MFWRYFVHVSVSGEEGKVTEHKCTFILFRYNTSNGRAKGSGKFWNAHTGTISYANCQLGLIKSSGKRDRYNPVGLIENTSDQMDYSDLVC